MASNLSKIGEKLIETLRRILNPRLYPKILISHARLAVTGFSQAGKTVFLTSLINHLKCHDPEAFKLHPDRKIRLIKVDDRQPKEKVWNSFPYEEYRACIGRREWPMKTKASYEYTLSFCRSDSFLTRHRLTIYDLPGERFADSAMTYMEFDQWSKEQLSFLKVALAQEDPPAASTNWHEGLAAVAEYLEIAQGGPAAKVDESELIFRYKRALVALRKVYYANISPSTFILDEDGQHLFDTEGKIRKGNPSISPPELVEEIIRTRHVGLPGCEFCPLGERWWREMPDLVQRLEKRYNHYKQHVVIPLFKRLTSCDGLVILVDVARILATGPRLLNEVANFLKQIFDALQPGGQILQVLLRLFRLRRRIQRIAVVASQCDRFHPEDWETLKELIRKFSERYVENIDGVKADYFVCSAVRSTSEGPDGKLRGVLIQNGSTPELKEYPVGRIPEQWADLPGWPSNWNPEVFRCFPKVLPQMPPVFQAVPEHVNLARIFGFVTGWFPKAPKDVL